MKIYIFFLVAIINGCSIQKKAPAGETDIELLKQLAYGMCLEQSIAKFSVKDSFEQGSGAIIPAIETYGLYTKNIYPIIDSMISHVIAEQIKSKTDSTAFVSEMAAGKTRYIIGCLDFYRSNLLDSTLKSIPVHLYKTD